MNQTDSVTDTQASSMPEWEQPHLFLQKFFTQHWQQDQVDCSVLFKVAEESNRPDTAKC